MPVTDSDPVSIVRPLFISVRPWVKFNCWENNVDYLPLIMHWILFRSAFPIVSTLYLSFLVPIMCICWATLCCRVGRAFIKTHSVSLSIEAQHGQHAGPECSSQGECRALSAWPCWVLGRGGLWKRMLAQPQILGKWARHSRQLAESALGEVRLSQ